MKPLSAEPSTTTTASLSRPEISLQMSRLALGGAPFGREIDESSSCRVLDYAFEHGITLIDTAESYGGGNARQYRRDRLGIDDQREVSSEMHSSERIIGRWQEARGCRQRIQICTKVSTGGSALEIRRSLNASLERLRTDYVDFYLLHRPFPDVPLEESLATLTEEKNKGKIRTIGCSNFSTDQFVAARALAARHGFAQIDVVQPPLSLADAAARETLLPYCLSHRLATMTYSPLAAGFLSGKYVASGDRIPAGSRFDIIPGHIDVYFSEKNFRIVENLRALAANVGRSMPELAFAWVLAQTGVTSVLVGARQPAQLDNALTCLARPLEPALLSTMNAWLDKTTSRNATG